MNTRRGAWDEVLQFVYQGQGFSYHFVRGASSLSEWLGENASSNRIILSRTIEHVNDEFFHSTRARIDFLLLSPSLTQHSRIRVTKSAIHTFVLCTTTSSNSTTLSSLSIVCPGGGGECLIFRYLEFRKVSMKHEGLRALIHTYSV